jgi:hypothetical protein
MAGFKIFAVDCVDWIDAERNAVRSLRLRTARKQKKIKIETIKYMLRLKNVLLLFTIIFSSCNIADDSSNEIIKEVLNGGNKKAVLFYKYGGATVPDSYQVSIMSINKVLAKEEAGNVFTCKDFGKETISIKWLSKDSLLIEYKKKVVVYIKKTKIDGVSILYREK